MKKCRFQPFRHFSSPKFPGFGNLGEARGQGTRQKAAKWRKNVLSKSDFAFPSQVCEKPISILRIAEIRQ